MIHKTHFEVRDYECDLQGIVNHAVYLHYLEHSRHQFLKSIGGDFAALHQAGLDLVVAQILVDYHAPLRSGDAFVVVLEAAFQGRVRLGFTQRIYRSLDDQCMLTAKVVVAGVREGRPVRLQGLFSLD